MSKINRILWYIYSRNFIQKGGNFTHFTQKDYPVFAAFVRQTPFNLGHWIFQEMIKFKFSSRRPSHIPYPSLVSVILFYHKIWYVGPPDTMRKPVIFGKSQLNYMKLQPEDEGSGQSQAPTRSQTRATHSRAHEAQSAPPSFSLPSDFETRIKSIVDKAVADMQIRVEFEMGKLLAEITRGNNAMIEFQDELKLQVESNTDQTSVLKKQLEDAQSLLSDQIIDLDAKVSSNWVTSISTNDKVDLIMKHLGIGLTSGAAAGPSSSSPQPDPQPSSPETKPSDPTPSSFEDDKGGEKED